MGQITTPPTQGITVNPTDRQSGPSAGGGATGNNSIFLGANAGLNSTISNFIVIGHGSGDGGIVDANLAGSIIIGVGSAPLITHSAGNALPLTLVGSNDLINYQDHIDSTVILGSDILNGSAGGGFGPITTSVFIGNALFPTSQIFPTCSGNVVIGYDIATAALAANQSLPINSVMIGSLLFTNNYAPQFASCVIIGSSINFNGQGANCTTSVAIGNNMVLAEGSTGNVVLGSGATYGGAGGGSNNNVVIGEATAYIGSNNVCIGGLSSVPANVAALGNVIIGFGAGTTVPNTGAPYNGLLVIESNAGAGVQTLIYGGFTNGNLVLGNSVQGTNRDLGGGNGTNTLKLINGTPGGAAPIGGGYFYLTAGVLHWIDSNGVDSTLSHAQGQLAATSGASLVYINNAGAQIATLTNGPTAGNPTKWIPINDGGTIRNIPAW